MRALEDITEAKFKNGLTKQTAGWLDYISVFFFVVFVLLAVRHQVKLLSYIEWGDESETIVAAKMIAAGRALFSEIFNQHGPLTFLPGLLVEKFGSFGVSGHRVPIAILQIVALLSIYYSPLLKCGFTKRLYTMAAASVMLLYLPEIFGHMYLYQVLVGLLLVVILAQYTLPAILQPEQLSARSVFAANILIAALPFLAFSYIPVSALLFLASLRREFMIKSAAVFAASAVANIAFLAGIGSIPGFLAFHIYFNSQIYNQQSGLQLVLNAFQSATGDLSQFICLLVIALAIALLAAREKRFPWRSILLGLGIGSMLIRAADFHRLPYFYSLLAIPLIFFFGKTFTSRQSQFVALILAAVCIAKLSLLVPGDREKIESRKIPEVTEFSQLARIFTKEKDRIIAYSFQNFEYIAADRLPASGHFFYLPWQERYNKNPKFGVIIDACKEISENRPKIMLIDKWKVWDRFPWDSYASCIQQLIDERYSQWPDRPYYIRKDLVTLVNIDDMGIGTGGAPRKMKPSPQLATANPIRLSMTPGHEVQESALKRIGVRFGTYVRQNPGEAELRLQGPDGIAFTQRFSLPDLADNRYRYFDLDSNRYTAGEIVSVSGGGFSTWESVDEKDVAYTCINYEYADGKRHFTPGCPLF